VSDCWTLKILFTQRQPESSRRGKRGSVTALNGARHFDRSASLDSGEVDKCAPRFEMVITYAQENGGPEMAIKRSKPGEI